MTFNRLHRGLEIIVGPFTLMVGFDGTGGTTGVRTSSDRRTGVWAFTAITPWSWVVLIHARRQAAPLAVELMPRYPDPEQDGDGRYDAGQGIWIDRA